MSNKVLQSFTFNAESLTDFLSLSTKIEDIYVDKSDYEKQLQKAKQSLSELQEKLFASGQNTSLLVIFQALDAAGKDGTIKAIFSDINPFGISFYAFKKPDSTEQSHDFLRRFNQVLPRMGNWAVFNRSYYEDVLVPQVHPEIIVDNSQLPDFFQKDISQLMDNRLVDINNYEQYLHNNGIRLVKFYLHLSKSEQAERLRERLTNPEKHWKFDKNDVVERNYWSNYQKAYFSVLKHTHTKIAPWFIIPADDKKNMRLIVISILIEIIEEMLKTSKPKPRFDDKEIEMLLNEIDKQNNE